MKPSHSGSKRFVAAAGLVLTLCAYTGATSACPQLASAVEDGEASQNVRQEVSAGKLLNANTGDTQFTFKFKNSGDTALGDDPRKKKNKTSVYVKINSITCDYCRAYVDGATSSTGPWSNQTVKGKATMKKKGQFCIQTYVHETGRTWARLTGWAESQKGTVKGLWSPDSKGTYKAINGNQGV